MFELIVKENKSGSMLINFILSQATTLRRGELLSALAKGDIKVNGKRVRNNQPIQYGDRINVYFKEKPPAKRHCKPVYEDENIIVAEKPAGLSVCADDTSNDSLEQIFEARACHRLDHNTGGLVLLSKTDDAYSELLEAFKNGYISKVYTCVVCGKPSKETGRLTHYLTKHSDKSFVKISEKKTPHSRLAELEYNLVSNSDDLSLLHIDLLTGRTHQIRAQLAYIGLPVLGDDKYGDREINKKYRCRRQLLWASGLTLSMKGSLSYLNGIPEFKSMPVFPKEIMERF